MVLDQNWIVMKFGGTSVSTAKNWNLIAKLAQEKIAKNYRVILVCSAVSGVSDKLQSLIIQAEQGRDYHQILDDIISIYLTLADNLDLQNFEEFISTEINELRNLALGISLVGESSSKIEARIMACGELILTKIGYLKLRKVLQNCEWLDARSVLKVIAKRTENLCKNHFLSAHCSYDYDEKMSHDLNSKNCHLIITQGFIASDDLGNTVLLGRGGSDVSASIFASRMGAKKVEIWTDVPGLFTSNPHKLYSARILKKLDYSEAQELASSGAKVLHPRCIEPLKVNHIPLSICWTQNPEFKGTEISSQVTSCSLKIKGVSLKTDVCVISMDAINMWQESGFVAQIFNIFKKHEVSVDLITTSQSNITVSLDTFYNSCAKSNFEALMLDLSKFCEPKKIGPCAVISLLGRDLRSLVSKLTPVFEVLRDTQIHIMSQAASGLNFSFVINKTDASRVLEQIHNLCFHQNIATETLGNCWSEISAFHLHPKKQEKEGHSSDWIYNKKDQLMGLMREHSSLYVYDEQTLLCNINKIKSIQGISRINYAMKANSCPQILKKIYKENLCFDCVSLAEVEYLKSILPRFDARRVVFTPNFASIDEYLKALELGCFVTLDNVYLLEKYGHLFREKEIFVRFDLDTAMGHHKYVQTSGEDSKFGISSFDIKRVKELCNKNYINVLGLHSHIGSGIFNPYSWYECARKLISLCEEFPHAKILDIGGGFGVCEKPLQKPLDLKKLSDLFFELKTQFSKYELWIEPGRFLVADAGVLLTKVNQLKNKGDRFFVGVDTGMNSLIRTPLYGSFHRVENLTRPFEKATPKIADIVGPICESGDVLAYDRALPEGTQEGDILAILNAGAYGAVMASSYNMRKPAKEVVIF